MSEQEIEELARQYIDSCTERNGFVILAEGIKRDFIDLFVAGFMKCLELKAGGQKWHKVADEGYPKEKTYVIVYTNLNKYYVAEKVENHFMSKGWGFIPMSTVIAWCEIPTFLDKETENV